MKKVAISFVATLLLSLTSNAQLTVSPYNNGSGNNGAGGNLQQFVQNNLIGSGITISNVTFVGANRQMGSFNATNTVLGTVQNMNTGIILSTGMAETAIGPNDVPYACHAPYTAPYPSEPGGYIGNTTNDPDLSDLVGSNIKDKAILEFDFVPTGPTIEFKYIFGSEEYPEFVNDFNDAFGFFLSGPGITGPYSNNSINLAIVPGTSDPVTINTVNSTVNSSYYVYNGDNGSGNTVAPYKNQNQYIQYDGYTTTLTATANVQCGQTYHIKIAIADARDQAYDSGLFIKGGS
ncbi:MAG TPA: choice-of-anchor L domain-containing protein, partial [Taishania sp.]|nr:choice-of-anchor L domain-containing protein [Taishania sp.]